MHCHFYRIVHCIAVFLLSMMNQIIIFFFPTTAFSKEMRREGKKTERKHSLCNNYASAILHIQAKPLTPE